MLFFFLLLFSQTKHRGQTQESLICLYNFIHGARIVEATRGNVCFPTESLDNCCAVVCCGCLFVVVVVVVVVVAVVVLFCCCCGCCSVFDFPSMFCFTPTHFERPKGNRGLSFSEKSISQTPKGNRDLCFRSRKAIDKSIS